METNNKLMGLVITLVVGIIICGSVLVPTLDTSDRGATHKMYNTGTPLTDFGINDTVTLEITTSTIKVNEQDVGWNGVLLTSNIFIYRAETTAHLIIWDESQHSNVYTLTKGVDTLSVTIQGGQATVTGTAATTSIDYTLEGVEWGYYYDVNGDYMYGSSRTIYYNDPAEITMFSAGNQYLYHEGQSYNKGVKSDITPVFTTIQNESIDMISCTGASLNEVAMPLYVVPLEVDYHLGGALGQWHSLLYAIPIMVIIALLMVAVQAATRNN